MEVGEALPFGPMAGEEGIDLVGVLGPLVGVPGPFVGPPLLMRQYFCRLCHITNKTYTCIADKKASTDISSSLFVKLFFNHHNEVYKIKIQ